MYQSTMFTHAHNAMYTMLKKVPGKLRDSIDLLLLPPVIVKNGLPCSIDIRNEDHGDSQSHTLEKGEENHFHIFKYSQSQGGLIKLRFKVSGYDWAELVLEKKLTKKSDQNAGNEEDTQKEVVLYDNDANSFKLSARISEKEAGFHVTFFAKTVLLNYSSFKLKFLKEDKQEIAGQDVRGRDFCLENNTEKILASLHFQFSKPIEVKNAGIKDNFSIICPQQ